MQMAMKSSAGATREGINLISTHVIHVTWLQ